MHVLVCVSACAWTCAREHVLQGDAFCICMSGANIYHHHQGAAKQLGRQVPPTLSGDRSWAYFQTFSAKTLPNYLRFGANTHAQTQAGTFCFIIFLCSCWLCFPIIHLVTHKPLSWRCALRTPEKKYALCTNLKCSFPSSKAFLFFKSCWPEWLNPFLRARGDLMGSTKRRGESWNGTAW